MMWNDIGVGNVKSRFKRVDPGYVEEPVDM